MASKEVDVNGNGAIDIAFGGTNGKTTGEARTNLGLGNVDNTSDANKPISTSTQTELDKKSPDFNVVNLFALFSVTTQVDGDLANMAGYFGTFPQAIFKGGGNVIWQASLNKNLANGGTVFDPATTGGWDGTQSDLPTLFAAQGSGVGSGCWVRQSSGAVLVNWFGGVGGGVDDYAAIKAAGDAAIYLSGLTSYNAVGSGGTTSAKIDLVFDADINYRISQGLVFDSARLSFKGSKTVIYGDDFADYLMTFTGHGYDLSFSGLVLESTSEGCVDFNNTNVSSAMVDFSDVRFITDAYGHETGIAVRYVNRSSSLHFGRCYFNRIAHPLHNIDGDFVTFDNCWFGWPTNATYAAKDGYIRMDKGFCKVTNSLFAGGPSSGVNEGIETAYFNMGIEGASAPAEDNPHLVISKTRIGFETGAGALVNWFAPNPVTAGENWRTGIILDNIETAPRQDKVTSIDGVDAAPILRLFTMPSIIKIDGVINKQGKQNIVVAGSTTTLAALRAELPAIDYVTNVEGFLDVNGALSYSYENSICPDTFIVSTSDKAEYRKWLEIFGKTDYWFDSDITTAATEVIVDTDFYMNADADTLETGLFQVMSGGRSAASIQVSPILGFVSVLYDLASGNITSDWISAIGYGALTKTWVVTPVFYDPDTTTELSAVAVAAGADYHLRLKFTNSAADNVRIRGAFVKPMSAMVSASPYQGTISTR